MITIQKIFRILFSTVLFTMVCSCSTKLETEVFSDKDVIGSYSYYGYSGPTKRELEIDFEEDHTGSGHEESYSTNSGSLISARKFYFTWVKKGNRVYLNGASGSANREGETSGNIDWKAEFEFKYDMFMPSTGFIEGYAEHMIKEKMEKDVKEHVDINVTYYNESCSFAVEMTTDMFRLWPDFPIHFGFRAKSAEYNWMSFTENEKIVFAFKDEYISLEFRSLKTLRQLQEMGYPLSQSEKDLIKSLQKSLDNRLSEISSHNLGYYFAIKIGDNVFEVEPYYVNMTRGSNPYLEEEEETVAEPEAVDLGLSVKWASFNLGATKPEEYGNYYAWGELITKTGYSWSNYRFRTGGDSTSNVMLSKYNTKASHGPVDNKITLDLSDDAAHYLLGGSWRMPTAEECQEIVDKCIWYWTTMNGVNGFKITSLINQQSIFLPATGYKEASNNMYLGERCAYFTSTLREGKPGHALYFGGYPEEGKDDTIGTGGANRSFGFAIRPVKQ